MADYKKANLMEAYGIKEEDFQVEIKEPFKKFMTILEKDTQEKKNLEPIKAMLDMLNDDKLEERIRITLLDQLVASHIRFLQQSDAIKILVAPAATQITERYMTNIQNGMNQMAQQMQEANAAVKEEVKEEEIVDTTDKIVVMDPK